MRQIIEQQMAQQAQQQPQTMPVNGQHQQVPPQQVAQQVTQQPLQQVPAQPQNTGPDLSDRANERFSRLSEQLRTKDEELQRLQQQVRERESSEAQIKQQMQEMQQQFQQVMQQNMDDLDPETRAEILQRIRMQELAKELKSNIMSEIKPALQQFESYKVENDLEKLSRKYPAFDVDVHGEAINVVRKQNPNLSYEQAFRVIATPEELGMRSTGPAQAAVPPIVAPAGGLNQPRYVPEPAVDHEKDMREEAAMIRTLMESKDPIDHRKGQRLVEKNLYDRLRGTVKSLT